MFDLRPYRVGAWVQDRYTNRVGQVVEQHSHWPSVAIVKVKWAGARDGETWEFASEELAIIPGPPADPAQ